jgi:hypothetical protein
MLHSKALTFVSALQFGAVFASPTVKLVARDYAPSPAPVVNQTTCNGQTYTYEELAGYGFLPSDARDKFGDTIGGVSKVVALEAISMCTRHDLAANAFLDWQRYCIRQEVMEEAAWRQGGL